MTTDCWGQDEFEDIVARSLIACYESKIKKKRGYGPSGKEADLAVFRKLGPYIPSNDRLIMDIQSMDGSAEVDPDFDMPNNRGVVAWPAREGSYEAAPDSYMFINSFEKVERIPKRFKRRGSGTLFKHCRILPGSKAISIDVGYFTLSENGIITPCDEQINSVKGYVPGVVQTMLKKSEIEPHLLDEQACTASAVLQFHSDRKHVWSIMAREDKARATLGCMKEEVKSLLYARSLPMTATGRKRPILHLVEAHQRRLKNGTDIDVSSFLRGTQVVEFGGTEFTVKPPASIRSEVTKASRENYYQQEADS